MEKDSSLTRNIPFIDGPDCAEALASVANVYSSAGRNEAWKPRREITVLRSVEGLLSSSPWTY